MLPPVPLEDPSRRPAILARPSEHDHDHEDRDAGVEKYIADRDHDADGRRDPDHVAQRRERITGAHEVMLRGARAEEPLGAGTCRFEGVRTHRHPTVHTDDEDVQNQSRHHEPEGREPVVHPRERQEKSVGAHEDDRAG
jgi:hypothetical protein